MTENKKPSKPDRQGPLHIPLTFEEALGGLLAVDPKKLQNPQPSKENAPAKKPKRKKSD